MGRPYNIDYAGARRSAAIGNFGSGGGNAINKPGPKTVSAKRMTAVAQSGANTRSPERPTKTSQAMGSGKRNGIDGPSPKQSKQNGLGRGSSSMGPEKPGPAGGLPGKGGPNRGAGVTRVKGYVKSEGF